jgi:hypothetical protein
MRTTLDLPDPTFRKLKAEASLRGLKLKEILCQLIEAGLATRVQDSPEATPRRSTLPVIRKPTGKKHPALSSDRLDELLAMEEGNVGR